ncbi:AMP-binding protein [Hyalangium gracile]|uniref:AMP-binding protein n=1 Tax=Hyalangium gracile TaxID=394092 RepID=UPI001CCBC153|nr:AMP-binding protein [Hyalangium gracile]
MTISSPHLISGPTLNFGPGMGVHPARRHFTPSHTFTPLTRYTSVADILMERARRDPNRETFFLVDIEDKLTSVTNAGMLALAQQAASALSRRGVKRGDRVFICFDTGPAQLCAFFGCSLLGAVPVMAEPPLGFARMLSWQERARKLTADAEVKAFIVEEGLRELAEPVAAERGGLPIMGPTELMEPGEPVDVPALRPDELAFIQFSSGTTSDAKGVMVTHGALMTNATRIAEATRTQPHHLNMAWLPLYHDMGLVGTLITPMIRDLQVALMPPLSFVMKPQRWLWAIHYFKAALSQAPNFAYLLCVNKIPDEELRGLNLSFWRLAFSGAEFIDHRTLEKFQQRFAQYGFRATTHFPVYGMAESVLAATFPDPDAEPYLDVISRERLYEDGEAVPVAPEDPNAMVLVGVGRPFPGHELRIVDADGAPLPERRQGQVLLKGPSLAAGYVNQPKLTAESFRDGWLWTGDLGYVADGELFISGRMKELIIKGGRNYHPFAFETAAAQVKGCRAGSVVAFGAPDPTAGTEHVVIVFETNVEDAAEVSALCKQVEKAVYDATGLRPDRVLPAPPRTLPKTSSGKLQRGRVRDMVLAGNLPSVPPKE